MNTQYKDDYKPYRAGGAEWIYPQDQQPPRGVKVNILTIGCVAIHGNWAEGEGFLAWQYLFKRNKDKEEEYIKMMALEGKKI
jgi:hypothetical protein